MPSQDVIQRTEELIQKLRALSEQSSSSQRHLAEAEKAIERLANINLGQLENSINVLASFNKNLLFLSSNTSAVKEIQNAFSELAKSVAESGTKLERMRELGRIGGLTTGLGQVRSGFRATAEDLITRRDYTVKLRQARLEAEHSRRELEASNETWKTNETLAQQIVNSQMGVLNTLASAQTGAQKYSIFPGRDTWSTTRAGGIDVVSRKARELRGSGQGIDINSLISEQESKTQIPINEQYLRSIGLSETAVKNLSKQLKDYGITVGQVSTPTTELSTGITTLSFVSETAGQPLKKFTAHIDAVGNVLQDTQKRFRTFGSAVMRDIVEVLKWTIAITAIYTPIRKMGELLGEMKKIQLDLVDVQIVLGNSTRQFATVLEASAQIATDTSSSLEGVVEGYSLAAAAAASARNETQRIVITQTLLKDSMVLSKLANIDQKQALDTLVGSLSQLGMNLTQGTQLLDSWVAVSKKANVSVNQMATSFTIVGSAAIEAGLNFNELNALVGALAQSTNLSADELGNAIRGIIAAMQTDKAQQAFAEYGIATKSVSGDFRDLMLILKQLKEMSESGLLDEKAMGALTQAGGAGARRGAQLSALVKNLDVVMSLVTVSEQASGDAAQALGLELETLDAAATRLNNSFSALAVTLGTKGGVLGFLTEITNIVTLLVTQLNNLVGVMKIAAPILGAFMFLRAAAGTATGLRFLGNQIPGSLQKLFTPAMGATDLSGRMYGAAGFAGVSQVYGRGMVGGFAPLTNAILTALQSTNLGTKYGRTATLGEFGGGILGSLQKPLLGKITGASLLGPAIMAASNIGQPRGAERAGIGAAGGLLMAAISGSPLWATVGSIIASAFHDKFLTFSDDIVTTWAEKIAEGRKEAEEGEGKEDDLSRLNREARESMNVLETLRVNLFTMAMNTWAAMPWRAEENFAGKNVSPEETALGLALGGNAALDETTRKKLIDAYNELMLSMATTDIIIVPETQQTEIARLAATASADVMNEAIEQIALGAEGSVQNYLGAKTLAQKVGSTATNLIDAQLKMMQEVTLGVGPTAKKITPAPTGFQPMTSSEAVKFVAGLNEQEASAVVSLYTQITDLLAQIDELNQQIAREPGGIATDKQKKSLAEYEALLRTLPQEFVKIMQVVEQGSIYRKIEEKLIPTMELPEMTPQQYEQVRAQAELFWREYLRASGLTDLEIETWIKGQEEHVIMMRNRVSQFRTNIPQEFFTPALTEAGISGQMPGIVDWSQYTGAQFQQAKSMYPAFIQSIQRVLPTFRPDESDALYFLKDAATVEHLDNTIMQMLMRDLIDVEKDKGLQGLYNLPSGATFYVPVTAYELHKQTQAGMAGGGGGLEAINDLIEMLSRLPAALAVQPQELDITKGTNLNEMLPGQGFSIGGKDYKMQGVVPGEVVQEWSIANPLPVNIMNWNAEAERLREAGVPEEILEPALRVEREYRDMPQAESAFPTWLQWIENIGPTLNRLTDMLGKLVIPFTKDVGVPNQTTYTTGQNTPISTALNLDINSQIVLTVDGRVLATIIKPYLYQDLIRYTTSASSSVNRSVVG